MSIYRVLSRTWLTDSFFETHAEAERHCRKLVTEEAERARQFRSAHDNPIEYKVVRESGGRE